MAKEYAKAFYKSKAWQRCRESYMSHCGRLCEICYSKGILKPAEIVHHKIYISPENIGNPNITLNFDNLQAVCRECHADIHKYYEKDRRYIVTPEGRIISK